MDYSKILNQNGDEMQLMIYSDIGQAGIFWDEIGAQDVIDQINQANPKSITVNIKSNGGSVFEGVAIYNYLKNFKGRVKVVVDSIAASIASVIAMAGDTIEMKEGSLMMIHDPMMMAAGNADEMRKVADLLDKVGGSLADIYVSNNRKETSKEQILNLMNQETWLTAKDAVRLGFADRYKEGKKTMSNKQLASLAARYNPPQNVINSLKMENNTNIFESITNFFKQKSEVDNALNQVVEPIKNEYEAKLTAADEKATTLENSLNGLTQEKTDLTNKVTQLEADLQVANDAKEALEAQIKEAGLPTNTASTKEGTGEPQAKTVHPFDAGLMDAIGGGLTNIYNQKVSK